MQTTSGRALVVLGGDDTYTGREPLVYRRTHGRGRVCYRQFGHDMRVRAELSVGAIARNAARWAGRALGSEG